MSLILVRRIRSVQWTITHQTSRCVRDVSDEHNAMDSAALWGRADQRRRVHVGAD
jgi:hypothetical protein